MSAPASLGAGSEESLGGESAGSGALCAGNARFDDAELASLERARGQAAAWSAAFERFGTAAPTHARGDFAVAVRDVAGRTMLAVDRFAIHPLCYRIDCGRLRFATRADDLCGDAPALDPQALYDYLYFHTIPAPRTVYANVHRLPPGHRALCEKGSVTVASWWKPAFQENVEESLSRLREEFLALLRDSVAAQIDGRRVGCFLSGGTDSSAVAGMLGRITGEPARTFSIGFDVAGYDEMEYARITARHFATEHHESYMTPDDLAASIPKIAAAYDQPFGNSSVAPAYHCAAMARAAGIETMLGGDGGDELFGGNTRYAKQRLFGIYERLPRIVRESLVEPALLRSRSLASIPGIGKAVSYVEQARVPMPDRLQMYNLLTRLGLEEVLTPEFRARIDADEPLRAQRAHYADCEANALINRMLAYDWKYTLADNDLPKVVGAAAMAGVHAGFPLLDDRLVAFSLRLAPALKLKGLKLRWFFKEALRGFLPAATLTKKKHGFGLPFGVWLAQHAALRSLALDSLALLRDRGIVRPDFLDRLVNEHLQRAPGYYGEMVWILMMLAQWGAAPRRRLLR